MGFIHSSFACSLAVWGVGEGLLAQTAPLASPASTPQPTTGERNEAPWKRKKECLWGLAFLGFTPIKTETGLQSQQKALACQTAAIRLGRIYGVCASRVEPGPGWEITSHRHTPPPSQACRYPPRPPETGWDRWTIRKPGF